MMELALIKTLLDRNFYDQHKGIRCPDKIFSKDVRKIKQALDGAMEAYEGDLTVADLEAVFNRMNASLTTATRGAYEDLFKRISITEPIKEEIAQDTLSQLFQQHVGDRVANLGFDFVNGTEDSLEPLRRLLEEYKNDFTPNLRVDWDDNSLDTILDATLLESKWGFNISSLARRVEGVSGGHLVLVGARPNTGKTSFHASIIAGAEGFAHQGAKCIVLCNEEAYTRVAARYISATANMTMKEVRENKALAQKRYEPIRKNVLFKDSTGKGMAWVESVVKQEKPDIVVLDMGDKFADVSSERSDITLKTAAIHARNIAKQYDCCVIWMSQLSAEAEGKVDLNQAMMEGSKTGKAAEADLMLLIGKAPQVEGGDEDPVRFLNLAKNKLNGYQGRIACVLDGSRSIYSA
ncbi:DnaB helicase C-terminal domain-containing protein [bacterium]|nr:DnaB helicase C-terminal domain-containing protein [bacterium]